MYCLFLGETGVEYFCRYVLKLVWNILVQFSKGLANCVRLLVHAIAWNILFIIFILRIYLGISVEHSFFVISGEVIS